MVDREGGAGAYAAGLIARARLLAPGWVVQMRELPHALPAAACRSRKVLLVDPRVRPSRDQLRAWLCDQGRGKLGPRTE